MREIIAVAIAVFFVLFLQFGWHVLLAEEPPISSLREFLLFLLLSLGAILSICWLSSIPQNRITAAAVVLLISLLWFAPWLYAVQDSANYARPSLLTLLRYAGLFTTVATAIYSGWVIWKESRKAG